MAARLLRLTATLAPSNTPFGRPTATLWYGKSSPNRPGQDDPKEPRRGPCHPRTRTLSPPASISLCAPSPSFALPCPVVCVSSSGVYRASSWALRLQAYVQNNDIYIINTSNRVTTRVTNDNSAAIVNGVPSWVYEGECDVLPPARARHAHPCVTRSHALSPTHAPISNVEEVFGTNFALWWSESGDQIAFVKYDETDVETFTYPIYNKDQYPEQINVKYPKARCRVRRAYPGAHAKQGLSLGGGSQKCVLGRHDEPESQPLGVHRRHGDRPRRQPSQLGLPRPRVLHGRHLLGLRVRRRGRLCASPPLTRLTSSRRHPHRPRPPPDRTACRAAPPSSRAFRSSPSCASSPSTAAPPSCSTSTTPTARAGSTTRPPARSPTTASSTWTRTR